MMIPDLIVVTVVFHTFVTSVILSAAKDLVISISLLFHLCSLLLPDPSTALRFAQDDKGKEFSERVQGGRSALGALSLTVLCFLPVSSLFSPYSLSDLSLSSPCFFPMRVGFYLPALR